MELVNPWVCRSPNSPLLHIIERQEKGESFNTHYLPGGKKYLPRLYKQYVREIENTNVAIPVIQEDRVNWLTGKSFQNPSLEGRRGRGGISNDPK